TGAAFVGAWVVAVLAMSRSAMIAGAIATVALVGYILFRHRTREILRRLAIAAIVVTAALSLTQLSFDSEKASPATRAAEAASESRSFQSRFLFWGIALEAFRSAPIMGVGGDNYITIYKQGRAAYSQRD